MAKLVLLIGVIIAGFVTDAICTRLAVQQWYKPIKHRPVIIRPTYKPYPNRPTYIRTVREVNTGESHWLWNGDNLERAQSTGEHSFLASFTDDIKADGNVRYVRNFNTPTVKSEAYSTEDKGVTESHLGENQRHKRSILPLEPDFHIDPLHPTLPKPVDPFRPHPRGPIYTRSVRKVPPNSNDSEADVNKRVVRSVDSPSAKRHGGHSSSRSRSDTGPTHLGHNRRNTRAILPDYHIDPYRPSVPEFFNPFRPRPGHPRGPMPIYLRSTRDIRIPNWNPNVHKHPWEHLDFPPARISESKRSVKELKSQGV